MKKDTGPGFPVLKTSDWALQAMPKIEVPCRSRLSLLLRTLSCPLAVHRRLVHGNESLIALLSVGHDPFWPDICGKSHNMIAR